MCNLQLEGEQHCYNTRRQCKLCPMKVKHEFAKRMQPHSIRVPIIKMLDIIIHNIFTHVSGFVKHYTISTKLLCLPALWREMDESRGHELLVYGQINEV